MKRILIIAVFGILAACASPPVDELLTPPGDVLGAGAACSANAACDAEEYCSKLIASCDSSTVQGRCQIKPSICPANYDPVCGCDGRTYSNGCAASSEGVAVAHEGTC